jgi:hypothetical protein
MPDAEAQTIWQILRSKLGHGMSPCPLLRCSWRISSATAYRQRETSKKS